METGLRPARGALRRRLDSGLRRNDGTGGWNDGKESGNDGKESGMETNERERGRGAPDKTGRNVPRLPHPHVPRHSRASGNLLGVVARESGNLPPPPGGAAPQDPADVPLDRFFIRF